VIERLEARGLTVLAGSRAGDPPFDWDDRATWAPALAGATAAYISYFPDLGVPGATETVGAFADVAVAALTEDGHGGRLYELTGPRLLTFGDAVGEIAAATGREIAFVPITLDEYAAGMAELGLPDDLIALTNYLFEDVLDGRNESVTDGVQRALGRAPRDFADYARRAAATGVWDGRR
jgi:hypothetical protein